MSGLAVLGSANMDLVVRQPRWTRPGETIFGSGFATGAGGKGLNQAVAAARAGARVSFLGAVGDDAFGTQLRDRLVADGIDVGRLVSRPEPTGVAAIAVIDDGENAIVVVPGANASAEFDEADREVVASASHLLVQLERPETLVRDAMAFARSRSVTTVLTPAPVRFGLEGLLPLADLLVANQGEAALLSGETDAERAAIELSRAGGAVVVTLGGEGALFARAGRLEGQVAAYPATAMDTTGAGDTFTGVLVAWRSRGASWGEALEAASVAGSLAVTRWGGADAVPTRTEIMSGLGAQRIAGGPTAGHGPLAPLGLYSEG